MVDSSPWLESERGLNPISKDLEILDGYLHSTKKRIPEAISEHLAPPKICNETVTSSVTRTLKLSASSHPLPSYLAGRGVVRDIGSSFSIVAISLLSFAQTWAAGIGPAFKSYCGP
ncbi:hypothetical protein CIHG_02093 [Coccidioides immitis H538.4]|uniref:Uncharacterized protein n=1 Tax=Coccidioides immitis H538.4 TaxID=396776 RepID=A0A0J8RHF8_COCIT|nr:hypothetical protein CIHG_02093 [Coccidioides immitis H538.4]